jgi:hypothetical protein
MQLSGLGDTPSQVNAVTSLPTNAALESTSTLLPPTHASTALREEGSNAEFDDLFALPKRKLLSLFKPGIDSSASLAAQLVSLTMPPKQPRLACEDDPDLRMDWTASAPLSSSSSSGTPYTSSDSDGDSVRATTVEESYLRAFLCLHAAFAFLLQDHDSQASEDAANGTSNSNEEHDKVSDLEDETKPVGGGIDVSSRSTQRTQMFEREAH